MSHKSELSWRDRHIGERLEYALENDESLMDVHFLVGQHEVKISAHKLILKLSSSTLENLIKVNEDMGNDKILLPNTCPLMFKKLLRYIYTDKVEMKDMLKFLEVAKGFGFRQLAIQTVNMLKTQIKARNVIFILEIAKGLENKELERTCLKFLIANSKDVLNSPTIGQISYASLRQLILDDTLNLNQLALFYAALKWGQFECKRKKVAPSADNIRASLKDAKFYLRFSQFTYEQMNKIVKPMRIFTDAEFKALIRDKVSTVDSVISSAKATNATNKDSEKDYSTEAVKDPIKDAVPVRPPPPAYDSIISNTSSFTFLGQSGHEDRENPSPTPPNSPTAKQKPEPEFKKPTLPSTSTTLPAKIGGATAKEKETVHFSVPHMLDLNSNRRRPNEESLSPPEQRKKLMRTTEDSPSGYNTSGSFLRPLSNSSVSSPAEKSGVFKVPQLPGMGMVQQIPPPSPKVQFFDVPEMVVPLDEIPLPPMAPPPPVIASSALQVEIPSWNVIVPLSASPSLDTSAHTLGAMLPPKAKTPIKTAGQSRDVWKVPAVPFHNSPKVDPFVERVKAINAANEAKAAKKMRLPRGHPQRFPRPPLGPSGPQPPLSMTVFDSRQFRRQLNLTKWSDLQGSRVVGEPVSPTAVSATNKASQEKYINCVTLD